MALAVLVATAFRRRMTSGRTGPLLVACGDPPVDEYVVKLRSRLSPSGSKRELLASILADRLGVSVPHAALVDIQPGFVDLVDGAERLLLERNLGFNFGSRFLGAGWSTFPLDGAVPRSMVGAASSLLAFDVVVENADRRVDNPNLLYQKDEGIFAIDHELAFSFLENIGGSRAPYPDEGIVARHPLARGLRSNFSIPSFTSRLGSLQDSEIEAMTSTSEAAFPAGYDEEIRRHLRTFRDDAPFLEDRIKAAFQ